VDFDAKYGHRARPRGHGRENIQRFDDRLPELLAR
jgi:phosphopentomutase